MPAGVPVATVAIDNARNAGLLAVRMLAISNDHLREKMVEFQKRQAELVRTKDAALAPPRP
jgi:5-(carboxyamino)imidazole ribonucleotide mutase